jgi:radical SAM protein with 4Fe4S-binding SPASM domain
MGFDSCSAQWFELIVNGMDIEPEHKKLLIGMSESCESVLMSQYINVKGDFYPCSFSEGTGEWEEGISVLNCTDFAKDVWFHEKTVKWRNNLLTNYCKNGCRSCSVFPSINVNNNTRK